VAECVDTVQGPGLDSSDK